MTLTMCAQIMDLPEADVLYPYYIRIKSADGIDGPTDFMAAETYYFLNRINK